MQIVIIIQLGAHSCNNVLQWQYPIQKNLIIL